MRTGGADLASRRAAHLRTPVALPSLYPALSLPSPCLTPAASLTIRPPMRWPAALGWLHLQYNPTCTRAYAVVSFNARAIGTVNIPGNLAQVRACGLTAAPRKARVWQHGASSVALGRTLGPRQAHDATPTHSPPFLSRFAVYCAGG